MPPIKKIVLWLIVIFLLYSIVTSPDDAANLMSTVWDMILTALRNIARFFDSLIRQT